jgi:hypothetical protein
MRVFRVEEEAQTMRPSCKDDVPVTEIKAEQLGVIRGRDPQQTDGAPAVGQRLPLTNDRGSGSRPAGSRISLTVERASPVARATSQSFAPVRLSISTRSLTWAGCMRTHVRTPLGGSTGRR